MPHDESDLNRPTVRTENNLDHCPYTVHALDQSHSSGDIHDICFLASLCLRAEAPPPSPHKVHNTPLFLSMWKSPGDWLGSSCLSLPGRGADYPARIDRFAMHDNQLWGTLQSTTVMFVEDFANNIGIISGGGFFIYYCWKPSSCPYTVLMKRVSAILWARILQLYTLLDRRTAQNQ